MGSGVYICGRCGGPLYAARPYKHRLIYNCRAENHLGRIAAPLDDYVEAVVLELPRRDDINRRLTSDSGVDIDALQAQRTARVAKKDGLATLLPKAC